MKTVCLDAGHGGHDPGAIGPSGLKESRMALDVCRRARDLLEGKCRVIMTRDKDKFLTLAERPRISNMEKADAFVSYHFNSSTSPNTAPSWEIYTTKGQNRSDYLATCIGEAHGRLFPNQKARTDRSDGDLDKEANFAVIRRTDCPSCLMEGEFIHTSYGEKFIADPAHRQRMAQAVHDGLCEFLNLEDKQDDPPVRLLTVEQRLDRIEEELGL